MASSEKGEAEAGTEAPGGVDDEAGHHAERRTARGQGLALQRRDGEPRDKRGQEKTEEQRSEDEASTVEPGERSRQHHAPDAAPEGERPELRHAEGQRRRERVGRARTQLKNVQQRERPLVEGENRDGSGEKSDAEPAAERAAVRIVMQCMSVHPFWTAPWTRRSGTSLAG